jgi:hypothetical protein
MKKTASKSKSTALTSKLQGLKTNLTSNMSQLHRAYPRALTQTEQAIRRQMLALKLAQRKHKALKGGKSIVAKRASINLTTLNRGLLQLKIARTALQSEFRRIAALQKTVKNALAKRPTTKIKSKSSRTLKAKRRSIA